MTKTAYTCLFIGLLAVFANAQVPSAPQLLQAVGYERHVEITWQPNSEPNVTGYRLYRSADGGGQFVFLKQVGKVPVATDWVGAPGLSYHYSVSAVSNALEGSPSATAQATTLDMDDEALLEMTQRATFRYFWDYAHPVSGMARERSNGDPNLVTVGGSGFGIMAIVVGAERGWVSREEALYRLIQIASFLQFSERHHGVWPHWIDGTTGKTIPFSQFDNGGDLVETAFLVQGLLAAKQYFDQNTPLENGLRALVDDLWEGVEWDWYRKNGSNVLYWHWSPNFGWQMNFPLRGFYEAQIVYILAAASPTHPVPASLYQTGWTSSNYANPSVHFGYPIYCGPFGGGPLFFAHYSYLGFDPRGKRDAFCNYFVRNRNHALIQHAYAIANPKNHSGYGPDCWGLTACDGPNGYAARDIWPSNDDGTIAPTAALSSMPYAPQECLAALRHFYRARGERLWGPYGFYDAFHAGQNWVASSYLAIDQGPIVCMIENYRTGLLWRLFMQNPEIQPALSTIGFVPDNSPAHEILHPKNGMSLHIYPNPAPENGILCLEFFNQKRQKTTAQIRDSQGRPVAALFIEKELPEGKMTANVPLPQLPKGIYWVHISAENGHTDTKPLIINH